MIMEATTKEKVVVWSNYYDYMDAIVQEYKNDGWSEEYAIDIAEIMNADSLDEIRDSVADITGRVICYGKLGLWNGPAYGYRIYDSLYDALTSEDDYMEWYIEGENLLGTGTHHDGTNSYLYRKISCTDEELDELTCFIWSSGNNVNAVVEKLEEYTQPLGSIF